MFFVLCKAIKGNILPDHVFSLEVLPAKKGDCLLLRYGTADNPRLALIDGGPSGVYGPRLEPRLIALRRERGVAEHKALPLDLVMLSHVDDDHVKGLLQLTTKLREAKQTQSKLFVKPAALWHNTFDDIIGNDASELLRSVGNGFGTTASAAGNIPDIDLPHEATVDADTFRDGLKVLASVEQGIRLRDDAKVLGIRVNIDAKGGLIVANAKPIDMPGGLSMTVIGPMIEDVKALQTKHDDWLKTQAAKKKSAAASLAAYVDRSVPNLSSLVVLAKSGGKSILLTGDARGDKILEGMKLIGLGDKLHVDVLKVPHHGSANNLTEDFFARVTADHYVFSGNGEHGNPERETFEMLHAARPGAKYEIYFNYEVSKIDEQRQAEWDKQRAAKEKKGRDPGPGWSPVEHGLVAFFDAHPHLKEGIVGLEGNPAHRIDLLRMP